MTTDRKQRFEPLGTPLIDVLVGIDAAGNVHTHAIEFEAYGEAQSASRTMLFREWGEFGIKPVAVCSGVTNGHGKFRESIHDD